MRPSINNISARSKIRRYTVVVMLSAVIALAVLIAATNIYVVRSAADYTVPSYESGDIGEADCIIVLGCLVHDDGTPSDRLEDRLETGTVLYLAGAAPKLLMSGDHGREDYDEVGAMKKFATDLGIPSEDVFMDHEGFSTYETMYRAREVFGCEKVIVVTQEYHLSRAVYIARELGLDAYGVAADNQEYEGMAYKQFREVLARTKDFFQVIAEPDAADDGVLFPISGDGDATNGLIGSYD